MKKLAYLFLTLLIVACSSDDDSNGGVTLNAQFVGSWLLEFSGGDEIIIEFNADGTGSDTEIYDGETSIDTFTWSTSNTQLTITYALDDSVVDIDEFEYNFITNDQVRLIDSGGDDILNRIAD
tara:strand:+ start:36 stop:404 length:369 start_codon:yes stop_codon:yes gene_type:complete